MILLDEADVVLTGGTESMSQAPHVIRGLRNGLRLGQGQLEDTLWSALLDTHCGCTMAATAENCAAKYDISREDQDRYALRSQQLASEAWKAGRFNEEIVPVEIKARKGMRGLRRRTTTCVPTRPSRVWRSCRQRSRRTAASRQATPQRHCRRRRRGDPRIREGRRSEYGLEPLGRLTHWATVGVEPTLMGMGPAPATRMVLDKAGLTLDDIDLFEVNEAFAAQYLAVEQELGLDRDKVNVNGGAIALGHPLGMTGTRLLLTLAAGAAPPRSHARPRHRVHRRRTGYRRHRRDDVIVNACRGSGLGTRLRRGSGRAYFDSLASSLLRLGLELAVFRRPVGIERRVEDALELGSRVGAATHRRAAFRRGRSATPCCSGRTSRDAAEVLLRLLLRSAEQPRHLVVPAAEGAVGGSLLERRDPA